MTLDTDQRFTPAWVLDIATRGCGPIHYDPCTAPSNPAGALDFSALPEDGLAQAWRLRAKGGLIWCNPPFSRGLLFRFAVAAVSEFRLGAEIVFLSPCDPSTRWFATLTEHARVAAQLHKRVRFVAPADQAEITSGAKGATMLWYLGRNTRSFIEAARPHAHLYLPGVV